MSSPAEISEKVDGFVAHAAMMALAEIHPVVVAMAPDAPEPMMRAWAALREMLPPDFLTSLEEK